ncbi:MAG: cache domain-containing protein, partial [Pseudomonadota bacterium]
MTFRTKLLIVTILPVVLISVAALILIDSQSKKLAEEQGKAVEQMVRQSKQLELQNYMKLARAAVEPFYQWDNVSRLQAQKQVADVITNMTYSKDGYFFISRTNGGPLENPLLSELSGNNKFAYYGEEAGLLADGFIESDRRNGELYQYTWMKPSSGVKAEKLGQSVYLDKWDWVIGSGLYMDDIAAQIGQIQNQLDENVKETRWVLLSLAVGAVALTSLLLAIIRFSEQRFADARLKALANEIVDAQENERKRVSTELHDGISQLLVSARYSLDLAAANSNADANVQEPIKKSMQTISTAIDEIRRISIALRPSVLDDVGLAAAVKSLGSDFESQTGIKTSVEAEHVGNVLDDREKTSLYRIAQEALANVAKHANATQVEIKLSKELGGVSMSIADDGRGLKEQRNTQHINGMGLHNMKERLESHGGTFHLKNAKNGGLVLE